MTNRRTRYQVFVGAPSKYDLRISLPGTTCWLASTTIYPGDSDSGRPVLPSSTLEEASTRISTLYNHVIFNPESDESIARRTESTTLPNISDHAQSPKDVSEIPRASLRTFPIASRTWSALDNTGTQDTCSYDYSDASSVANFPAFHFNLHSLSTIGSLIRHATGNKPEDTAKISRTVNLLAAVLEIQGPETIIVKRGPEAGKDVTLLKMIIGDDSGAICKLTAWRDVAEEWSDLSSQPPTSSAKKGDIVYLENILVSWESTPNMASGAVPITCSASPQLRSRLQVCFRAMPSTIEDSQFRPDLRVGLSDAVVRRVASVVNWFEGIAGLSRSVRVVSFSP
ncbi:hypothetical protein BD311DRAFT_780864 [Dichomitus squalens]|uniref:Shieldin complex subunit 2 first OB fold domain-containing protein n=1 Tax=Dichomitus squalens TaxID=114155 RepID=A0A4Q9MBX6_9APHY|nr:hypothetical protein BD311DRAFT_780864 [Dichomitus squalens]